MHRVKSGGEGRAREAEIWGKSRSPGWNASRGTPDAVPSAPPPPEARRTRPRCPPSGNTQKEVDVGLAESLQPPRGGKPKGTFPPKMLGADTRRAGGGAGGGQGGDRVPGEPWESRHSTHWPLGKGRKGRRRSRAAHKQRCPSPKRRRNRRRRRRPFLMERRGRSDPDRKKIRGPRSQGGNAFYPEVGRTPRAGGSEHAKGKSTRASRTSRGRATAEAKHGVYTLNSLCDRCTSLKKVGARAPARGPRRSVKKKLELAHGGKKKWGWGARRAG